LTRTRAPREIREAANGLRRCRARWTTSAGPAATTGTSRHNAPGRCATWRRCRALLRADGLVAQGVVGEHEGGHGLDHGHGAGKDTRVMASAPRDGRLLVLDADGLLRTHDRRRGLERHAEVHGLSVGDAALHATAPVAARADAVAVHVELVVVLAPGQIGARESRADLEALACGQAQHALGQVGFETVENGLAPSGGPSAHR